MLYATLPGSTTGGRSLPHLRKSWLTWARKGKSTCSNGSLRKHALLLVRMALRPHFPPSLSLSFSDCGQRVNCSRCLKDDSCVWSLDTNMCGGGGSSYIGKRAHCPVAGDSDASPSFLLFTLSCVPFLAVGCEGEKTCSSCLRQPKRNCVWCVETQACKESNAERGHVCACITAIRNADWCPATQCSKVQKRGI